MSTTITLADVAEYLTGADANDGLGGWPGLHAEGNVVHITVKPVTETPSDEENDETAAHFLAVVVEGETAPIVLPRPDVTDGMELEGGSFHDDDAEGWQVVPYSSDRDWVCGVQDADSLVFRGDKPRLSFAEARRFAAALAAVADAAEAAQAERVAVEVVRKPAYVNGDDGYKWLTCEGCETPLIEVDAGTGLDQLNAAHVAHKCAEAAQPKGGQE